MAAAQTAVASGRLDEAESLLSGVLETEPGDWQAKLYLGITYARSEKGAEAERLLKAVLEERPETFEAAFWLSVLYRKSGELEEAFNFARKAARLQPDSPHAQNNLGFCAMEANQLEEAASAFGRSVQLRPDNPIALYNHGTCLGLLGRDAESLEALARAAAMSPGSLDIQVGIAKTLLNLGDIEAAIYESNEALRIEPNSAPVHRLLALAYMHQGKSKTAREHVTKALDIEPENGHAFATLGSILQTSGSIEESNAAFAHSIELEPKQGYAYFCLVHNKKLQVGDRDLLRRMEALVLDSALPPKEVSNLHYGLGKGYEDLGEYETAMEHYDAANRLARRLKFGDWSYDSRDAAISTDLKMRRYTPEFFERVRKESLQSEVPIFIVGMMRSGTTLVEQILSSHPLVEAGGEQEFWLKRGLECLDASGRPDLVKLRILAREYLKTLKEIGSDAAHVTDKMPANCFALGPIHGAFPRSKIIHTRRNPVDTAISIYATPNRARVDYAHDKGSIVQAYKEYLRMMRYWRKTLPPDRFLEVRYEQLIENREETTRALCEFCGLEWDEAMLHPENNERSVVTPSVWQVRQPVYRSSMDRWKKFEPWLGAFAELIGIEED